MNPKYLVFDCESVGLHGEAFWVAWVLLDEAFTELSLGQAWCDPKHAAGVGGDQEVADRVWLKANVLPRLPAGPAPCWGSRELRDTFWNMYESHGGQELSVVGDVTWPVEANFLRQCALDSTIARNFRGPFPLLDVASMALAVTGDWRFDPPRKKGEKAHHPLDDARHTAECLRQLVALTGNEQDLHLVIRDMRHELMRLDARLRGISDLGLYHGGEQA